MSKRKVKWAMWSLGKIANRVIKEMRQADTYEIVAVCSSNYTKAQNFIESNQLVNATAYTNIEDVLKREDVDIVYVASPPWLHKEQCFKIMNAGKNCLVEKPMTQNAQDAVEIFECAKSNNVFCAEGVWSNYFPAMRKAKQWMQEGRIGEVVEVIATFGCPIQTFGVDINDASHWGNNISQGGGALSQFGCYSVNLAQFVYNQLPEKIIGVSERIDRPDGGDLNSCFILSDEGASRRAMLSCSWTARTQSIARISGTEGEILIGNPFFCPYHASLYTHKNHLWYNDLEESFDDPYEGNGCEGFKYQFESVSQYILEGKKESDDVSYKHSIELATTMERIRKTLNHIE